MGLLYVGIQHECVYLEEYLTLFMQATRHISVNGFEKCYQVFFKTITLTLKKAIIIFLKLIVK
jgi:hypothetical protein